MNKKSFFADAILLLCLGFIAAPLRGEPTPVPAAPTTQGDAGATGGARVREFQGDDVGQVLRLLARQAKVDLMVADAVQGKVNMRLENKTAMEAIEVIVHANKLTMTKEKGVYYLEPPAPPAASAETDAADEKTSDGSTGEEATSSALDFMARPETAGRIAKYKRNLYNALTKEGFTTDQAVQIVAADRSAEIITSGSSDR